jgi:uncharacterized Ntn-hydrolase superfamily protein/predicted negative regulator of RcsB-dependent stress response
MSMSKVLLLLAMLLEVFPLAAHATYSIVACDSQTRECGVAVQTNNLAVGASVPYAQAGVGALASQFETNPMYGPRGLALLGSGKSPDETLQQLLREDGNFDGEGTEARQVGIVAIDGRSTYYTGQEAAASDWAGGRKGNGYSVQGNGLAGPQVVEAMERAFVKTPGALADRLLAALVAGDAAGGQKTGRESAALLVRTPAGFPMDIDLRVDHSVDPVAELAKLYAMQSARQQVVQASFAARKGDFDEARSLLIGAVARAPWPRLWIRAAKVAEDIEERQLALQYITMAFSANPAWVQQEIGSGDYAELGSSPLFHEWVTADHEQLALSAYRSLRGETAIASEKRLRVGRMLLEVGHAHEALALLTDNVGTFEPAAFQILRAEAYVAIREYGRAIEEYKKAASTAPHDPRIQRRIIQLKQQDEATEEIR